VQNKVRGHCTLDLWVIATILFWIRVSTEPIDKQFIKSFFIIHEIGVRQPFFYGTGTSLHRAGARRWYNRLISPKAIFPAPANKKYTSSELSQNAWCFLWWHKIRAAKPAKRFPHQNDSVRDVCEWPHRFFQYGLFLPISPSQPSQIKAIHWSRGIGEYQAIQRNQGSAYYLI